MIPNAAPLAVAVALAFLFFSFAAEAQSAGRQMLTESLPPAVAHLAPIGQLAGTMQLNLAIGLPLRNQSALQQLLDQIYDPASPEYRHYLTPQEFTDQFGPSESDYQTVEDFFRTNNFSVNAEHPDRLVLDVSGTVADVERVFGVTMRTYRHPNGRRTFFSADTVPSLDLSVPIQHVSGLDNYSLLRPHLVRKYSLPQMAGQPHETGSGPGGTYLGSDLRNAYLPGVSLTGSGQTLGLLEFDGYYSNDIATYEKDAGLSAVTLTNVSVDGGVSSPGPNDDEVALDIEVAISIAPGLSKIVVYEAPTNASFDDILSAMANDTVNSPKQFSCSWGNNSPGSPDTTAENLFLKMKTQGQSFFNASGDSDAFSGGIPFPSESTNVTQVGGTTLTTTGPGGAWYAETTWDWGGNPEDVVSYGSSGGVSANFKIPSWQQGVSMATNLGSTTMRNVPDVAMTADNIYVVADNGTGYYIGGTSCAAPAWAAFTALANQQAAAGGKGSVGFINPAIYAIGKSAAYTSDFRDITTGNNFWGGSTNKFRAVPGFDLCTGWGSPGGDTLIDALAGVSDSLSVAPGMGFVAFGPPGGPFTSSSLTFSLTNSSATTLAWSLINSSPWLTASPESGVLGTGNLKTNVTVSLDPAAYSLPPGTYTAGIVFSNQSTHATRTREFTLSAGQSLLQNGNLDDFVLSDWAQSGGVYGKGANAYPVYNWEFQDSNGYSSGVLPHSGTYCEVNSCFQITGYLSQNIPTVPGQSYLLSFWFTSLGTQATQLFLVNWNTNSATTNTILNLLNPAPFPWTYTNFILAATSTNTLLQFGGRDDYSWFGLEDVSVIPVPTPNIRSVLPAPNNSISFTWNSLTNVAYQVQYSTNLLPPHWTGLSTYTATGPLLSATNSTGTYPAAFYRVLRVP